MNHTRTPSNILVTGGAGFIGSHFVEEYATTHHIRVYDNFTSSVISDSELAKLGVKQVLHGDIRDTEKLTHALSGVDTVFHFAVACVRLSLSDERYVHDVNASGTLSCLLAAKKAGVKHVVYISSSEVYGTTNGTSIDEHHEITPQTVYGMSKYVGELYAKHFNDKENLRTSIVRPFNSYGPRAHFDGVYGEVIPRFSVQALNGIAPTIFGDGTQTRDFTYVKDTVRGIYAAAINTVLDGTPINIAYGKEVSVNTIASHITKTVGLSCRPSYLPKRPNDVDRLAANIEKAKKMLHFSPQVSIEKGIPAYISWIRKTYANPSELLKVIPKQNW